MLTAAVVIGSLFVLAAPRKAAAQVSLGFGIVIGGNQGPSDRGWYGRDSLHQLAFNNGYADGYDKGRDDGSDRRVYDPLRHKRFRQADHKYERRFGPKAAYQNAYRNGFRAGYDAGYLEKSRFPAGYRDPGEWSRRY
jgi:flagellar biosynthesis/type III secretory pathway protein FliH